jgi:hypothetical protein
MNVAVFCDVTTCILVEIKRVSQKPAASFFYPDSIFCRHSRENLKFVQICRCFYEKLERFWVSASHKNRPVAVF